MPGGSGSIYTESIVLSDNYISYIVSVATDAWPIYFGSGYNVTITGNVINTYAEGGSGDASAIRWNNITSGDCNWVTIADNVIFPNGNVDYGIEIRANSVDHLSITGNIIEQTPTTGVILKAGAGGTISYVTFANNTISCFISNFIPNGTPSPKANVNYVTITGNTLELVATPINWNVYLEDMNYVTMTGNTMKGISTDSSVGRNLVIDNTSFAIIHSNIMKIGSGAKNIMFESGSTHWSIAANILDQGVGGTGLSIDETNSSHASGEAQAFCNLSDTGTTPPTPNVDGVTMTLNGQQTNLY
jgi:hypothetical protein